MKKFTIFLTLILLGLLSCTNSDTPKESMTVLVPNGTPSIAQAYMEHEESSTYIIDRVSGPQSLVAAFTSQSHDIIIAPVNLGANLYQKGIDYQLLGVLTWSNLQVISRFEINDLLTLSGKNIIAYGQGSTPEMIIDFLISQYNFQDEPNISYQASSVQEAYTFFLQDEESIAIVSEPISSQAKTMINDLYVLDLAAIWTEQTQLDLFPQAGVFVKKSLEISKVIQYLEDIEIATNKANDNPSLIANYCESLDYPFDKTVIESSIRFSQIDFQSHLQSHDIINEYLNLIIDFKSELIGNQLPDNDFYYPLS